MIAPVRRFRALPMRSRLALLVATAVAVAVAAVAAACWLLTRAQLQSELDNSLRNTSESQLRDTATEAVNNCVSGSDAQAAATPGFANFQVVLADGQRCVARGSEPVKVHASDQAVANSSVRETSLHDSTTDKGATVRVFTQQGVIRLPALPGVQPVLAKVAVSVSRPLSEIDNSLNRLALLLAAVAGIGVVGAGAPGCGWRARGCGPSTG